MSEYLNEIHDSLRAITQEVEALDWLARSFSATGNQQMDKMLSEMAASLEESRGRISDAVSKEINDEYVRTQQSTANMIGACLSGLMLKEEGQQ